MASIAHAPAESKPQSLESNDAILRVEDVTVEFDGFKAVQDLSFSVATSEVRFLIGPNGAGKTTILDAICGRVKPSRGHVWFKDRYDLTRFEEHRIARLGVGRKFQTPSVFLSLSTRDNLALAQSGPRNVWSALSGKGSDPARIDEVLSIINLHERAPILAGALSHGEKQWLEIGMLLMQNPDVLLLDEPAAGMTDGETEQMGELLHSISARHSILVVEHDMEFVRRFAHRVTVMHEGKVLCEGSMDEVQNNAQVAEVYLGRRVGAE